MICYRDMTFCRASDCRKFGKECGRSFTEEVKQGAFEWMGENAPIAFFTTPPEECYEPVEGLNSEV